MQMDLVVFAAHPDDAELAAGGLVAKTVKLGYRVAIVDLTRGELGTRGTPEQRAEESAAADRVLGVAARVNLGLPDGGLTESTENRRLVVDAIRRHRPSLVAAPYVEDLHPDHAVTGRLVEASLYPSGFAKYETGSEPHRPQGLIHYMNHYPFEPTFVLDVSDVWAKRMEAVMCYASQLHRPGSSEPATNISAPDFLEKLEARFRHYGSLIGATFGEPYWTRRPLPVADPIACFVREGDA
ncbi:MAG: bacillithiol biosynthesis deacetylase BshB1 [Planctomycetota bacterium]|jgi:bacillithiol biosynthesis deacetylase BshB1